VKVYQLEVDYKSAEYKRLRELSKGNLNFFPPLFVKMQMACFGTEMKV